MGTLEFILGIRDTVAKQRAEKVKIKVQRAEPIVEANLYTILGFKSREDFDKKINKLYNNEKKQQKLRDKLWKNFENQVKKENSNAAKNISRTIEKFNSIEDKLNNLLIFQEQAQNFLEDQRDIIPNMVVSEVQTINIDLKKINIKKRKPDTKTLTSNTQDFRDALEYIKSFEKSNGITLKVLSEYTQHPVKIFLPNYTEPLNKKYPKLRPKIMDTRETLSDSWLREVYNNGVEEGTLQSMASYQECKDQRDKMDQIEKQKLARDVKKIDQKSNQKPALTENQKLASDKGHYENLENKNRELARDIKKMGKLIKLCIGLSQNLSNKQERSIDTPSLIAALVFQKTINDCLSSMSEETKNSPDVKKFQKIMDGMHTEHNTQQADEKIDSALICLTNTQNKLNIKLKKKIDPSTGLKALYISTTQTEVTRL